MSKTTVCPENLKQLARNVGLRAKSSDGQIVIYADGKQIWNFTIQEALSTIEAYAGSHENYEMALKNYKALSA
jgi:hypothetical protein